jgi:hypothetical protein
LRRYNTFERRLFKLDNIAPDEYPGLLLLVRERPEMSSGETAAERIVRREIVKYFHKEIHNRYRLEHILSIPEVMKKSLLDGLSQVDVDRFESLFLYTVYPELESREKRDRSFVSLVHMLRNPRALVHIIPAVPRIMLKYGAQFPYALRIGLNSVLAFNHSMRLENKMVANLIMMSKQDGITIDSSYQIDPEDYRAAYTMTPYAKAKHMIELANSVMTAGSQGNIMDTAWSIMDEVQASLIFKDKQRGAAGMSPEHAKDIDAIEYGKSALDNIRSTFNLYDREGMLRMIDISLINEMDYIDKMYNKKK